MTTVAILPESDASGKRFYRAIAGKVQATGTTAGEALDALTAQLEDSEFGALLIVQNFRPDRFFSAQQQKRLSELMSIWRTARDRGDTLPLDQQAELDNLVQAELQAAIARTETLMQQMNQ
ncbi:MAG TPA: hypothetical protein DCY88_16990 [Cyanobacteria bacterium UBA11372]|nr:hypothetical protein [Cyanobacteria bacterium UBA11372]